MKDDSVSQTLIQLNEMSKSYTKAQTMNDIFLRSKKLVRSSVSIIDEDQSKSESNSDAEVDADH